MNTQRPEYRVPVFTGIRPTGDLTMANYLGAVRPILDIQQEKQCMVFVADLHALTDTEPAVVKRFTREVVADYLALGLDPAKTTIFVQSDIGDLVNELTLILARHISVAELLRVPTLKDKLKKPTDQPETANALLALYPVMMAADILLQRAKEVPVGEDQVAHMEVMRRLARRFNQRYAPIFPIPKVLQVKALRILSLGGQGKMSKSEPGGALFLTDTPKQAARKVKQAKTAFAGQMPAQLASLVLLAKGLTADPEKLQKVEEAVAAHQQGEQVMASFKEALAGIVVEFLENFQARRAQITADPIYIPDVLEAGAQVACKNATETLEEIRTALQFT